jgi:hypothetical protein
MFVSVRLFDYVNHHSPIRRLSGQHDSIGSVIDSICNIGTLRTSRARVVHHAFKHLRRRNDRLSGDVGLANQILLRQKDLSNKMIKKGKTIVCQYRHHQKAEDSWQSTNRIFLVLPLLVGFPFQAICFRSCGVILS